MPSDDRARFAFDAVAGRSHTFRTSLAATIDDVKGTLAASQRSWDARVTQAAAELGPLAAGRVDAARFASLFLEPASTNAAVVGTLERAVAALEALAARGDDLLRVPVAPGASLYGAVADALAAIGRGFAAARAVAHVRAAGRGADAALVPDIAALPFSRWNRHERQLTPPLVVEVHGADLKPAALAEFMDGRVHIALVVDGEAPPASLVRLVAPGTFVMQTHDVGALSRLAKHAGPGVAAVLGDPTARFVHDPTAGASVWERLAIESLPERPPRRPVAGLSVAQQVEELDLLRGLAARPAHADGPPAAGAAPASEHAERLASWLLSQVDLSEVR